jgi:hypothetical protein
MTPDVKADAIGAAWKHRRAPSTLERIYSRKTTRPPAHGEEVPTVREGHTRYDFFGSGASVFDRHGADGCPGRFGMEIEHRWPTGRER